MTPADHPLKQGPKVLDRAVLVSTAVRWLVHVLVAAFPVFVLPGSVGVARADPPAGAAWEMTFHDEFARPELDLGKWLHACDTPRDHLSSRWPENVELKNGACRLLTRKEHRDGKDWTAARIYSRSFYQRFGYFEARIKAIGLPGINNGFWLRNVDYDNQWRFLQIDVVAVQSGGKQRPLAHGTRYPNNQGFDQHLEWDPPVDLGKDFHVYGLLWDEKEVIWYVDGREIYRVSETLDPGRMRVELGTAVGTWAGQLTDALDGTAMEVDYVRVFQRVDQPPPWPAVLNGVQ